MAVAAAAGLLAGCAQFDDTAASESEWSKAPELTPQRGPQPDLPEAPESEGPGGPGGSGRPGGAGPSGKPGPVKPPKGCTDYHAAVIGTCLDTVTAVAALPSSTKASALAAEQKSGTVYKVVQDKKPKKFAQLDVKAAGQGGLTGLALSPAYTEDQLVFAYITTATDNRVVRFAKGRKPKAVLTGIPKGSTGNRGVLATDPSGALVVATGNAGSSKAADNPKSLAGKVLRINTSGKAATGNPDPGSRMIASGLRDPGGVCTSADGGQVWVTDRTGEADAVFAVDPGKPLGEPVWRWKDKPGAAGCADAEDGVYVAMSKAGNLQGIEVDAQGSVVGQPHVAFDGKDGFGRLAGMDVVANGVAVVGTVNKDGGKPVSSDDRVVVLPLQPAGGRGKD